MLQASTIKFLADLKKNNNKEWFEKNRATYEFAKENFVQLITQVIQLMEKKDASIVGLEAKKCVFRINRDVRFSKDKSPYKTNMGASINKGGKKVYNAGYYFHLEPNKAFIAAGFWMPPADKLQKIRQEIDYNFSDFKKTVSSKQFINIFKNLDQSEKLSRPPKGYDDSNEAIDFLKLKSFVVTAPLTNEDLNSKDLAKKIVACFEILTPFVHFLNKATED